MWCKLLIVATCLYLAKASGEPSILGDEDASNLADVTRSARSTGCSYSGCNSFCQKLGHARGVCIGSYCQCRFRKRRSLDEDDAVARNIEAKTFEAAEAAPSSDLVDEPINDSAAEVGRDVSLPSDEESLDAADHVRVRRSCGAWECNNHCKKLGHARGVCIGTYCQCRSRKRRSLDEGIFTVSKSSAADSSKDNDIVAMSASVVDDHIEIETKWASCNLRWCEQICRRFGFAGGVCANGRCKCDNGRSAGVLENSIEDNLVSPTSGLVGDEQADSEVGQVKADCDLRWCDQNCRRMGFTGGVCVNGRCKCDINLANIMRSAVPVPFQKFDDELEVETGARACNIVPCFNLCRRLGFRGAMCRNGRCICFN
ncbi:tenascin-like [Ostrinia nubilalis]|uniref:tenascin-like n=1 Tax=Ostrinia nubilalis TaxID=29057 RepID=UPI0030823853